MSVKRLMRNYGGATGAVGRWLQKDHPDYGLSAVWQHMSLDTLENFTRDAKAWLGDRSELRSTTINNADYAELFRYFRSLNDLPPLPEEAEPQATEEPKRVEIPGLGRSVPVREDPPAPRVPKGVHLMKEGFPEGRYAVEIDGEVHCFWFKYHRTGPKRFMEETLYRREDGKWVSIMHRVPEWKRAIEIIKSDSYTQAVRFGTETGHCSNCGRRLTREDSLKRALGDRCAMQEIHAETLRKLFG